MASYSSIMTHAPTAGNAVVPGSMRISTLCTQHATVSVHVTRPGCLISPLFGGTVTRTFLVQSQGFRRPMTLRIRSSSGATEAEMEGWRMRKMESQEADSKITSDSEDDSDANTDEEWRWTLNWNHVLPNLMIGSCPRSPHDVDRIVDEAGATAIINLQSDLCFEALQIPFPIIRDRAVERGVWLARVPIRDFDHGDQAFMLPEAVRVLHLLLHRGHTVYVHCTAGINRASLLAVAYLYFIQGCRRDEAIAMVKIARRVAHPYIDALMEAKRRLLDGRQEEMTALATSIYEQRRDGGDQGNATSDWSAAQTAAIAASFRKFLEVDMGILAMEEDLQKAAAAALQQQHEEAMESKGSAVAAEVEMLQKQLMQQQEELSQLQATAQQWQVQKEQAEELARLLQQDMKAAADTRAADSGNGVAGAKGVAGAILRKQMVDGQATE